MVVEVGRGGSSKHFRMSSQASPVKADGAQAGVRSHGQPSYTVHLSLFLVLSKTESHEILSKEPMSLPCPCLHCMPC